MLNIKAEKYEREFETLPDGIYKVEIVGAGLRSDEYNKRQSINFKFMVENHERYNGRIIFLNIFLKYAGVHMSEYKLCSDEKTQMILRIAKNKLNGILEMTKISALNDSSELIGKKLQVKIKSKQDKKDPTMMRTDVVDFFDYFYISGAQNSQKPISETVINPPDPNREDVPW